MAVRNILILFVLLIINGFVSESATDTSCIQNLPSFIATFSSNETSTDNVLRIQETFYLQNKPAPHYVIVHYCYDEPCNNNNAANYSYIWTDNPIFFVVDYYLFKALTFGLADLGDIGEQSFVVPLHCDNNTNKDLLLALTSQLKSIGGNDKAFYYARHFDFNEQQQDNRVDDYDGAKIVIFLWLLTTTLCCITALHYVLWSKETRNSLGRFLKRFVQKSMPTNNEEYSPISESENDELILFFLIKRAIFPVIFTAVVVVTATDLYFLSITVKYHQATSDIGNFVIFFPWPIMVCFIFVVNAMLTVVTLLVLVFQESIKWRSCECFKITVTLLLLFGIVYLVYHGFWIIVALLAYPGRILIGGIFVVPFLLASIPTWNLLIKVIEKCRRCKGSGWRFLICCKWFLLLVADVMFWGLFIGTLIYTSRFLLGSSVNLENKTFQSLAYFVVVSAISGILTWLNTDFIKYQKDNRRRNSIPMNGLNQNVIESPL